MPKLTYTSIAALIADFQAGAKFRISGPVAVAGPVDAMRASQDGNYLIVQGLCFKPDGSPHWVDRGQSLVKIADAPGYTAVFKGETPALPEPFLKQFVLGTPAYVPKTRETVTSVTFVKGDIVVALLSEDGKDCRESINYDHTGKHKFVPERSLVLGELPMIQKPAPAEKEYTSEDLYTTAPVGTYSGGGFKALVLQNGDERAVLFLSGVVSNLMSRTVWSSVKFTRESSEVPFLKPVA